jgi:hypothetical protein
MTSYSVAVPTNAPAEVGTLLPPNPSDLVGDVFAMLTPFENLTTERQGDVAIVRVKSGLTLGCDLRSILKELAAQTGARYVLLDLSNVTDAGSNASPVQREPEPCMRSEVYFG